MPRDLAAEGKAKLPLARMGSEVCSELASEGAAFLSEAAVPPAVPESLESSLAPGPRLAGYPGWEEGTAGTAGGH